MKMRLVLCLLVLGSVFQVTSAHAAFFVCSYQQEACNENGDHYYCCGYGWVGPGMEYCSSRDMTSNHAPVPAPVCAPEQAREGGQVDNAFAEAVGLGQ